MNERIRELVVKSDNGVMRDGKLYPHIGSRTEEDWKQFAELIVRECADIADCSGMAFPVNGWVVGDKIRKHFGVK